MYLMGKLKKKSTYAHISILFYTTGFSSLLIKKNELLLTANSKFERAYWKIKVFIRETEDIGSHGIGSQPILGG